MTCAGFGMPGVSTWNFGEGFSAMFLDSVAMNHNAIGRGYETFGNSTAETLTQSLSPEETSPEWYRVLPPPTGRFSWSARDNVNYTETGALAAQEAVTRTPGTHVRVSFALPDHPIAYGYSASSYVFRQNSALYSTPRRWLRMAYCTSCLDGPVDARGVVLQWGDANGEPLVVSGQVWGGDNLIGGARRS